MAASGGEESKKLKNYSYWLSTCSCRVRIGLNLKGLEYEYVPVNLLKEEQHTPEFLKLNPVGYVPVLVDGDVVLADSFAILMYLEEKFPQHPLLPKDLHSRGINYQKFKKSWVLMQMLLGFKIIFEEALLHLKELAVAVCSLA